MKIESAELLRVLLSTFEKHYAGWPWPDIIKDAGVLAGNGDGQHPVNDDKQARSPE